MAAGVSVIVFAGLLLAQATGNSRETRFLLDHNDHSVDVRISTTKPLTVVDDHFVGVTMESAMLLATSDMRGLNLSSPKVQLLAKALSPSYLRLGGTSGDKLTFDPTGHQAKSPKFTAKRWDDVIKFVKTVGWDLIFSLNALKRHGQEWDPTNAKQFINYNLNKKYTLAGLELGNEPRWFHGVAGFSVSGRQLGQDFMTLKNIMRAIPALDSTLLIGGDFTGFNFPTHDLFTHVGAKAVDRITVHHYYAHAAEATIAKCLDASFLDTLRHVINTVYGVTHVSNPKTPVWLGETSSFSQGGAPNISDRYVAGFLWLDKLGLAAKRGIKSVLRQTFYGPDHYSLLDTNTNGFRPNPDYWLTLLYKRLVGNKVLNVTTNGGSGIRMYAHCTNHKNHYGYAAGSVTLFYLNINSAASTTTIRLPQFTHKLMQIYSLTPVNGYITDKSVALNGKTLSVVHNTLPAMAPVRNTQGFVRTQRRTFGFIVIPDADLHICKM